MLALLASFLLSVVFTVVMFIVMRSFQCPRG
jgi:hypothetical protein